MGKEVWAKQAGEMERVVKQVDTFGEYAYQKSRTVVDPGDEQCWYKMF